jgi:asparagine synthase (glutamine-hydrolysing)
MCGITGIFSTIPTSRVSREHLQRMTSTLSHRGPDEGTVYVDGQVGLGHRRLSIIDVASGTQPIFNEDRTKAIVFNGEIYNFTPLRTS